MALTLSGQRFALFKKTPDFFLFAAIHGALPVGPTLRVVQKNSRFFFIRCHPWRSPCRANASRCSKKFQIFLYSLPSMALTLLGQRYALFKIAPGNFIFLKFGRLTTTVQSVALC
jgi:hypothetical protein